MDGKNAEGNDHDVDWEYWEKAIKDNSISIDRPKGSRHPRYNDRIYPLDYGYINNIIGTDNEEVDIFVGSSDTGLVGALLTTDTVKNDKELKLLWNVTDDEAHSALSFVNFGGQSGKIIWRKNNPEKQH